jgi:hypothetical protein
MSGFGDRGCRLSVITDVGFQRSRTSPRRRAQVIEGDGDVLVSVGVHAHGYSLVILLCQGGHGHLLVIVVVVTGLPTGQADSTARRFLPGS